MQNPSTFQPATHSTQNSTPPFTNGLFLGGQPGIERGINTPTQLFDLKVYARLIWHWSWLLVLATVVAAVGAYLFSIFSVPIYQASTTILIDQARNASATYQDLLSSERIARTYAELMLRETTMVKVATEFDIDPAILDDVLTGITVTPVRDTQLIKVVIEGTSPEFVAAVADMLPTVFIAEIRQVQTQRFDESRKSLQEQLSTLSNQVELQQVAINEIGTSNTAEEEVRLGELRNQLAQYQSSYTNVLRSYEELRLTEVQSMDSIVVVEQAKTPKQPIRPRILLNTLIVALMGLALALGAVFLIEYLDDRIKTPDDLKGVVSSPILGAIARIPQHNGRLKQRGDLDRAEGLITALQPRHPITEAYRSLRTNLQFSSVDATLHSLLVTSATPGEGKTTTAANLAVVLAQSGLTVLLVDADIRKPQQHKVFQVPKSPGLTDALLAGEAPPDLFIRQTMVPNLRILTSGKEAPNPAELLGSQRMHQLIETLRQQVDMIIFDAPPLLAVTDAQVLARETQGVLLVINTEKTPRAMIARAAESLQRANAHLFGTVLNRLARSPRSYYYYYDSYSYYYDEEKDPDNTPKKGRRQRKQEKQSNPKGSFDSKLATQTEGSSFYNLQPEKPAAS